MNYLVQRAKVRQQAINVPDGLPELLSDITREVLRCQPTKECLCQFIIDYLQSVIITREKAMVARSILDRALRKVDEIITDLCVCDITKVKTDLMAQVMEDCFRNFLERVRCEKRQGKQMVKFDEIDLLEELLTKCNFSPDELDKSRPVIESAYKRFVEAYMAAAEGADGTELLYQYFRDRELKRIHDLICNQAATQIQAAYRGYKVRAAMSKNICTCTCALGVDMDTDDDKRNQAARVIQRFFRSRLSTKQDNLLALHDPCEPSVHSAEESVGDVDMPDAIDLDELAAEPQTEEPSAVHSATAATPAPATPAPEPAEPVAAAAEEEPPAEVPAETTVVHEEPQAEEPQEEQAPVEVEEPAESAPEEPAAEAAANESPAAEEPPTQE